MTLRALTVQSLVRKPNDALGGNSAVAAALATGCAGASAPTSPASQPDETASLASVRKEIASDGAVWHLGMYDRDITSDGLSSWLSSVTYQDGTPLPTKHPFTAEVAARVVTEGGDIYCIVPAHAGDSVSICQWPYSTTDDGQWSEKAGDTLYASDTGEPVLIQASAGEFNPNFAVSIHGTDGRSFENHVLVTSGMDGKLVLPSDAGSGQALLSDFSPYAY